MEMSLLSRLVYHKSLNTTYTIPFDGEISAFTATLLSYSTGLTESRRWRRKLKASFDVLKLLCMLKSNIVNAYTRLHRTVDRRLR